MGTEAAKGFQKPQKLFDPPYNSISARKRSDIVIICGHDSGSYQHSPCAGKIRRGVEEAKVGVLHV
jgi:hypothetical protein